MNYLEIRKISTHNLKNIDLKIPLNSLVVITGPSGVGKSSLAIDTIAEEGKARLLQILNYTKNLSPVLPSKALFISSIPPVIPLTQGVKHWYPYKTVAEILNIFKFIEVLFIYYGKLICSNCGFLNKISSIGDLFNWFQSIENETKFYFLIPIYEASHKVFEYFLSQGYVKYLIDEREIDLSEEEPPKHFKRSFIVLDKMIKTNKTWDRFLENIRSSLMLSNGRFTIRFFDGFEKNFTVRPVCFRCGFNLNTSWSYCKQCRGLGYKEKIPCEACEGLKLNPYLLMSKIANLRIKDLLRLNLKEFRNFLEDCKKDFKELELLISSLSEKFNLIEFLEIDYLTLATPVFSLSIGERKLLEIFQIFAINLNHCLYILDEPTFGLDLEKRKKVLKLLRRLIETGNSVVCIEHDPVFISEADFIVELGYSGGEKGGYLLKADPKERYFLSSDLTITLRYLLKRSKIPKNPMTSDSFEVLRIEDLTIKLKLGAINLIYGKVGSGKTKIFEKIKEYLKTLGEKLLISEKEEIKKREDFLINYLNIWDILREFFVKLPYARMKGFNLRHFSFHTKEGMCLECKGKGKKVYQEEGTLMESLCEDCLGKRLNREVLNLEYKGLKLYEILELSIEDAFQLFSGFSEVQEIFSQIIGLGLGYLKLSQEFQTLSGGEKTRISLIKNFLKKKDYKYAFLEFPFEGLHLEDVKNLYRWFQNLLVKDVTIVILETNPLAIALSDFMLEIKNNKVIFQGEVKDWLEGLSPQIKQLMKFYLEFVSA